MIVKTANKNPWIVLIHGFGVTEKVWFAPLDEKTLFMSFRTLLKEEKEVISFSERLKEHYNIASWTQGAHGTIDDAVIELKNLVDALDSQNMFFVAHSRGGLVARRAIQQYGLKPKALICLSTPHHGSRFADLVMRYFTGITFFLPSVKPHASPIRELCTDSDIVKEMNQPGQIEKEKHVPHYDIAGNSTAFFGIRMKIYGKDMILFHVMRSIERIFGSMLIPEWRNGEGDGFVKTSDSKSPLTSDGCFHILPVNHSNILVRKDVYSIIYNILQTF